MHSDPVEDRPLLEDLQECARLRRRGPPRRHSRRRRAP
jgi:hypothetical protein